MKLLVGVIVALSFLVGSVTAAPELRAAYTPAGTSAGGNCAKNEYVVSGSSVHRWWAQCGITMQNMNLKWRVHVEGFSKFTDLWVNFNGPWRYCAGGVSTVETDDDFFDPYRDFFIQSAPDDRPGGC